MIAKLSIPGGWMWSAWQPERGIAFNSYLFERAEGGVAVDPLPVDDRALEWMASIGGVHTIVVTNRDHRRECEQLRARFGSRIIEEPADGEEIFAGAYALKIPHGKAPEFAIHLPAARAAVVGDAMIGAPAGALSLLPDEKLEDPERLLLALRRLWALELETLLLCDGQPIFGGADAAIGTLLQTRGGAEANRINMDELAFRRGERGRYRVDDAEVGLLIGARKLGYRVAKIPPGRMFCPLHSHEMEEEFFFVLEGNPSIRTLRGTIQCRPGDFIAFPVGEVGTHQLLNDSAEPCTLVLAGNYEKTEICFYPDSKKVLIDSRKTVDLMVRSFPALDYYEGE